MVLPAQCRRHRAAEAVVRGCLVAIALAATASEATEVAVTSITVDGREFSPPESSARVDPVPLRLPAAAARVQFQFRGPVGSEAAADDVMGRATRLRFRLDGRDTGWRDLAASGRVLMHFLDADGVVVDAESTTLDGESPGWRGVPERSEFQQQSLVATAPAGASLVQVSFLSHNAEQVVGCLAVDDIALRVERPGAAADVHELLPHDLDLDALGPHFIPEGWHRPGSKPDMSTVRIRTVPEPHPVLFILDDDPTRFGNWATNRWPAVPVQPGDRVTLSWSAAYSFGSGGTGVAGYTGLAPGNYWFRVGAFRPNGEAAGDEASLQVIMPAPLSRRPEVWAIVATTLAAGGLLLARTLSAQRLRQRLKALEQAHALERERSRIARDLHDEIGAKLTEIAMRADAVRTEVADVARPEAIGLADGIWRIAADLVRSVDAIVWAVNPAHDTLDRFAAYLVQSTEQFLDAAGVSMRFAVPEQLPHEPLPGTVRHALFLAVREAQNNALKHARCKTMTLGLSLVAGTLEIVVTDDGQGFDPHASGDAVDHLGLDNMRRRMEDIGGHCTIHSPAGRGTVVTFTLPLPVTPGAAP
jgi:signal transduction histidine kinase